MTVINATCIGESPMPHEHIFHIEVMHGCTVRVLTVTLEAANAVSFLLPCIESTEIAKQSEAVTWA